MKAQYKLLLASSILLSLFGNIDAKSNKNQASLAMKYYNLATSQEKRGDYEQAIYNIQRIVHLFPTDPSFYITLGHLQEQLDKTKSQAINSYQKAVSLAPNNPFVNTVIAKYYYKTQDYSNAIKYYEQAINIDPSLYILNEKIGEIYYLQSNYPKSYEYLKTALQNENTSKESWLYFIQSEIKLNYKESAVQHLLALYQHYPKDIYILNLLSETYISLGETHKAQNMLDRIIQIQPDNYPATIKLAKLLAEQNNYSQAILLLEKIYTEKNNKKPELNSLLGEYHGFLENYSQSTDYLKRAVQYTTDPQELKTYEFALLQYYTLNKDLNKAEPLIEKLIIDNQDNIFLQRQMANLKLQRGFYKEANVIYWTLLEKNSSLKDDPNFLFNYATSFEQSGKLKEAEIVWTDYIKLRPHDYAAWLRLIDIEENLNYVELALQHLSLIKFQATEEKSKYIVHILDKEITLNKKNHNINGVIQSYNELFEYHKTKEQVLEYIDYLIEHKQMNQARKALDNHRPYISTINYDLRQAKINEFEGDSWDSASDYQKILSHSPDNITALIKLADIYMNIGQYQESEKLYKRILELEPENFHAQYNYGLVFVYQEKIQDAIIQYEKALELDSNYENLYWALGSLYLELENKLKAKEYWEEYLFLVGSNGDESYLTDIYETFPDLKK